MPKEPPQGLHYLPGLLGARRQRRLLEQVVAALARAPLFTPVMPRTGRPFSVRMSNFGPLGWVSDRAGYRYQPRHPDTGEPWPGMPGELLRLWDELTGWSTPPEACLINHYAPGARLGLHVDRDEEDLEAPIVSISLGCEALFRIGGPNRRDPTMSFRLCPGDVLVLGGESRLCHHGIDRIHPGTGELPPEIGEGRINLTLRRMTRS